MTVEGFAALTPGVRVRIDHAGMVDAGAVEAVEDEPEPVGRVVVLKWDRGPRWRVAVRCGFNKAKIGCITYEGERDDQTG